jgi:hypothetical protein
MPSSTRPSMPGMKRISFGLAVIGAHREPHLVPHGGAHGRPHRGAHRGPDGGAHGRAHRSAHAGEFLRIVMTLDWALSTLTTPPPSCQSPTGAPTEEPTAAPTAAPTEVSL